MDFYFKRQNMLSTVALVLRDVYTNRDRYRKKMVRIELCSYSTETLMPLGTVAILLVSF